jgi:L-threonylcarbamoyladenylate synthase
MSNTSNPTNDHPRTTILPRSAPRAIEWSAEEIARGGVVAIPTDTVYGLVASLAHEDAIDRIYALKGRPAEQPLPVLVSSIDALEHVTSYVDGRAQMLLNEFWPGPLTVVIPSDRNLPDAVLGPGKTVGVRMPNHPLAIEVIAKAGGVIASTSANRSTEPPALTAAEVEAVFGAELDIILDGGIAPGGQASTVVAIRGDSLAILRQGPISESKLQSAWDNYPTLV